MRISVALTPKLLAEPKAHVVAVVDVLRASTTLVTMFERGLLRAIVTHRLADARELALRNFSLLCGEVKSVPLPGFDYGNSPAQFATLSLRGKSAVLFTTNGTRAIGIARDAPFVCAGALVNRRATGARLLEEASKRNTDIAIVCAGNERGRTFSLEDSVAAGSIVESMCEADGTLAMTDSSWAALHLWRFYRGDAMRVIRQSVHGRALAELGFEEDLRFASQLDVFETVPVLSQEDGMDVVRARARTKKLEPGTKNQEPGT